MKCSACCIILCTVLSYTTALSCMRCRPESCTFDTSVCKGGIVMGPCGCCPECAKLLGEECGGPWDISGLCDKGLFCYKSPEDIERMSEFNADGRCVAASTAPTTPRQCEHPKVFRECATVCPLTCDDPKPQACVEMCKLNQCVCPPDLVQRSLSNETCVELHECPGCRTDTVKSNGSESRLYVVYIAASAGLILLTISVVIFIFAHPKKEKKPTAVETFIHVM